MYSDRRVLRPIPPTPHCAACSAAVYRWRGLAYRTADAAAHQRAIERAIRARAEDRTMTATENPGAGDRARPKMYEWDERTVRE